jgi:hypothetical protein
VTPVEIQAAIQAGALLFKLVTDAIAAGQATEAERSKVLDQLEDELTWSVERCRALKPVPMPTTSAPDPSP